LDQQQLRLDRKPNKHTDTGSEEFYATLAPAGRQQRQNNARLRQVTSIIALTRWSALLVDRKFTCTGAVATLPHTHTYPTASGFANVN
jgi:hypothetical protein